MEFLTVLHDMSSKKHECYVNNGIEYAQTPVPVHPILLNRGEIRVEEFLLEK